jgi:hypothetical protein
MTAHITNPKLAPALIPSADADFADVIFPFAMTYCAYDVWGDLATVRGAAEQTWATREKTGELPTSLAKLRTSLFAAARYMRMTDFDEDITGIPGSEAAWIALMREHVAAIGRAARRGPNQHLQIARATAEAGARIVELDAAKEYDLRVAVGHALGAMIDQPVASSASQHEHSFVHLPLWAEDNPPGPFDVTVGDVAAPILAAEVKLSNHNTLSHSLWDVLKLLGVLALAADHVYLIGGFPIRIWQKAEFAALYTAGTVQYTALSIAKEWPSLLKHSRGVPLRIPKAIEVSEVARIGLVRDGEPWELRTVAIEPTTGGWLELRDGRLDGARPYPPD